MERGDLHVHIDRHINKEDIIKILKLAESNGVKKMSLTQHNKIDQYLPNSPLMQMVKSGEIKKYYTGELIPTVELDVIIDKASLTPNGKNYNGRTAHIQLAFDLNKLPILYSKKWWNEESLAEIEKEDYAKFVAKGESLGLDMPSKEFCDAQKDHLIKGLYAWMKLGEERTARYSKILGLTEKELSNPSAFFRKIYSGPGDIMYYESGKNIHFSELVKLADEIDGKIILNHPAYMDPDFNLAEYLFVINSIPPIVNGKKNLYAVECKYNLNTALENEEISEFAYRYGLRLSAGSDFILKEDGKMFVIDRKTGEKFFYTARPGTALDIEHHKGYGSSQLFVESNFLSEYAFVKHCQAVKNLDEERSM